MFNPLLFLLIVFLCWLDVSNAISPNDGIVIRGLLTSSNVTYVAGQELAFDALRTDTGLFFTRKLGDFELNVCRHLLVRNDPKTRIRQVTYSDVDTEGWVRVKLTLPSDLNTGYYYFLWESPHLGFDKARTDNFKVISAAEANASRLLPVQMSLAKTEPSSPPAGNNVTIPINGGNNNNGTTTTINDDDDEHDDDKQLYDDDS